MIDQLERDAALTNAAGMLATPKLLQIAAALKASDVSINDCLNDLLARETSDEKKDYLMIGLLNFYLKQQKV